MIVPLLSFRFFSLLCVSFVLNAKGRGEDNFIPWFISALVVPIITIIVSLFQKRKEDLLSIQDIEIDLGE